MGAQVEIPDDFNLLGGLFPCVENRRRLRGSRQGQPACEIGAAPIEQKLEASGIPYVFTLTFPVAQVFTSLFNQGFKSFHNIGVLGGNIFCFAHIILRVKQLQTDLRWAVFPGKGRGGETGAFNAPVAVGDM